MQALATEAEGLHKAAHSSQVRAAHKLHAAQGQANHALRELAAERRRNQLLQDEVAHLKKAMLALQAREEGTTPADATKESAPALSCDMRSRARTSSSAASGDTVMSAPGRIGDVAQGSSKPTAELRPVAEVDVTPGSDDEISFETMAATPVPQSVAARRASVAGGAGNARTMTASARRAAQLIQLTVIAQDDSGSAAAAPPSTPSTPKRRGRVRTRSKSKPLARTAQPSPLRTAAAATTLRRTPKTPAGRGVPSRHRTPIRTPRTKGVRTPSKATGARRTRTPHRGVAPRNTPGRRTRTPTSRRAESRPATCASPRAVRSARPAPGPRNVTRKHVAEAGERAASREPLGNAISATNVGTAACGKTDHKATAGTVLGEAAPQTVTE